ncbi:MAG: hypothetical protein AAF848_06040 [Pseudomonadota bacterium]
MSTTLYLAAAFVGALCQELLHWYNLRHKLELKTYRALLASPGYWVVTILMLLLAPVGVLIWFYEARDSLALRDFFVCGAAFPTLVKAAAAAAVAKPLQLGGAKGSVLGSYLS